MKRVLAVAALGEAFTGLALAGYPSIVARMLFGADISGEGVVLGRIAGIGLIALGVACWPGGDTGHAFCRAVLAMLWYSLLATFYLTYQGVGGRWVGPLLWPAAAIHAILTVLLARAYSASRSPRSAKQEAP